MTPSERRRRLIGNLPSLYKRAVAWQRRWVKTLRLGDEGLARLARQLASPQTPRAVKIAMYVAAVRWLTVEDPRRAIEFGEGHLPLVAHAPAAAQALAAAHVACGAIVRPLALLMADAPGSSKATGALARLRDHASLLEQGMPFARGRDAASGPYQAIRGRVLYYVASSLPYHSTGYAIRTHGLMRALQARGLDMHVVARAGYPNDRWDYPNVELANDHAVVDGVPYYFAPSHAKMQHTRDLSRYHAASVEVLLARCRALRPAVIHAASNYTCGLAAAEVGARLGVPVIYEMRGLWHVTKTSTEPGYLGSDHFRMIEGLEVQAAQAVAHVFTITSGVRDVLLRHGVDAAKISLLPNAVDVAAFAPTTADPLLIERLGLRDKIVVGYIGSFVDYEGLDYLLEAAVPLRARFGDAFRLLLVGDGAVHRDLVAKAKALGVAELAIFTGRVPFNETQQYYAVMDMVVLPRRGTPVCEIVSPLKPFEAMAMNIPVVASDVAALADIVRHGETGLLHAKDDVTSLTEALARLIEDPSLRHALGAAGGAWVRRARDWHTLAGEVEARYEALMAGS